MTEPGIFSALKPADRQKLELVLKPRQFRANETIFTQEEEGHSLYIIRKGRVKVCVISPDGEELVIGYLSKGDILGEMAILDGKSRSATAIAVENTETHYIERPDFLNFLRTYPQASVDIINMLCQRLRETDKRLEENSFLGVSSRVALRLAELAVPESSPPGLPVCSLSQEELARVVRTSRVTVNQILRSFAKAGLITLGRRKITIINSDGLKRISSLDI